MRHPLYGLCLTWIKNRHKRPWQQFCPRRAIDGVTVPRNYPYLHPYPVLNDFW